MAKVRKQFVKKKRRAVVKKTRELRDQMVEIGDEEGGIKLSIYGRSKTGKTRFACTFPKPLMLIGAAGYGTEKGTRSLGRMKGSKFFPLGNSEQISQLAEIVLEDGYKTVVLDTAGGLQERVVDEYLKRDESVKRDWRTVPKGDWVPINGRTIQRIRCLLDLADQDKINTVIIAHERSFNAESESDLIFPTIGSALTPGVAGWLNAACDFVCQTHIREQTVSQTVTIGRKETTTSRKTGRMEYCLRTGPHPVYITGFRVPMGVKLPDDVVDPSYEKVLNVIEGG